MNSRLSKSFFLFNVTIFLFLFEERYLVYSSEQESIRAVENQVYIGSLIEVKEASCCPGKKEFVLSITNKETKDSDIVSIYGRMESVRNLMITQVSNLIVVGNLRYGGNAFLIIDMAKKELQGEIWTYDYAFSPSQRFLVYETHYPRMGLPETRRSILLLYDFTKSAGENRVPPSKSYVPEAGGFIPDNSTLGIPIFPETNAAKESYVVTLEGEHLYLSPFLWSDNEKHLAFVVFYREQNYLVHIDLSGGIVSPTILRERIDLTSLIRKEAVSESLKQELKKSSYKLAIEEIHWQDTDRVVLRPYRQYWLSETIELSVPQK